MPRVTTSKGYKVWVPIYGLEGKPDYFINKARAWHNLTRKQKERLEEERSRGRFGGENAKGVGRAPYFWVVSGIDKEGAMKAGLSPGEPVREIWEIKTGYWQTKIPSDIARKIRR